MEEDAVKLIIFILLSYIVPVIGIGFSIYLLINATKNHYGVWVKRLAVLSLCIQLLPVLGVLVGMITWIAA
ncbi:hypothetical protein [Carnobacterium sp.]|uniref:hypothetical protein n=1 Tax=Carnobacterium sp. TaxID=48221 RepID=UPI00388FBFA9